MTEATQTTEVTGEAKVPHARKGRAALTQVAGVGMALMGSSLPGTAMSGGAHVDHGHAPARWAAAIISGFGWLVGGIAFPFDIWWLVILGAVLQPVAIVVNLVMNAAGYGAASNDHWARAKAEAKAALAAQS